jgi:hypothetical protein
MRFNLLSLIILLIIYSNFLSAQSTYFIKYKENVTFSEMEQKVQQDSLFRGAHFNPAELRSVDYLAKGIAKSMNIGRIIKITY